MADRNSIMLASTLLLFPVALVVPSTGCVSCLYPIASVSDAPADYETAVNELLTALESGELHSPDIAAGTCDEGETRFVFYWLGDWVYRWDYFDSSTSVFIGRKEGGMGDMPFLLPCLLQSWPRFVACDEPVVTDVIAGTRYAVGDGPEALPE